MKLYELRFFHFNQTEAMGSCFLTLKSSDIPRRGAKLYLGNDKLLNGPDHMYKVERAVRCYSGDQRDLDKNDGDALTSVEIEVSLVKGGR